MIDENEIAVWSSAESLEQLLSLGLPPRLNEVSEIPLRRKDFAAFRPQAEKCLCAAGKICTLGERYILISICQRFPSPELHLPPVLNISDSYKAQNKRVGAQCLAYLSKVFTHNDDQGGRADVIVECLLKLSYSHDRDDRQILLLVYEGLKNLVLKAGVCHSRRSTIFLHLLRQCGLAVSLDQKIFLGKILVQFIKGMGHAGEEYAQMILELIEVWADASATRPTAMVVLQYALSYGTISKSWERVARVLLSSAVRCMNGTDNEVAGILLCRLALNDIRTTPESPEEAGVFDGLRDLQEC
ncbi:hypothetical protein BIW11_05275 [Tropilaelaps mercedesae]|uniref:Uncharacterized protein n=1 Tax=Tropilaelaps mercedesae TaxID=418985 RepID=A0A1V9Y313_9ACAR|nr:hypothetical protein BIW11_05275 [Tropilaelaps mercedesae]